MLSRWTILKYPTVASTQDTARELAKSGEGVAPFAVVADHQSQGRGRSGRVWESNSGNLMCSLYITPHIHAAQSGQFSFLTAVSVSSTLEDFGIEAEHKWPNDVLVKGKKIAGVLLESQLRPDGNVDSMVIGIGLNIASAPEGAVSLQTLFPNPISRDEVLSVVLTHFDKLHENFHQNGFAPLREKWLKKAIGIGQKINVRLPNEEFSAVFEGISEEGALLARPENAKTVRIIHSGDVFLKEGQSS